MVDKPLFTKNEVLGSIDECIKPWTTRGPDILLSEIIKGFRKKHTGYTIGVINGCLKGGVFPEWFMEAVPILIEKSANQFNTGTKYRPICFINVLGKSPRRARCEKVEETLVDILSSSMGLGAVNPSRCGATQRKAWTKKYLLALDVENAFN